MKPNAIIPVEEYAKAPWLTEEQKRELHRLGRRAKKEIAKRKKEVGK